MMNNMLSQDEIDALLRGTADDEEENATLNVDDYLTSMERDALGEIGNISFGSSATALSTLLSQKVEITTPTVTIVEKSKLKDEFPHPYISIQVKYTEGFSGINMMIIKQSDASVIADLMLGGTGQSSETMDEIHLSAVQEAMNQMMGSAATSMSTVFNKRVDISPPTVDILNLNAGEGTENIPDQDLIIKISFRLKVGDLIDSSIMQVLPLDFGKRLVDDLFNTNETKETKNPQNSYDAINEQVVSHTNVDSFSGKQTVQPQATQPIRQQPSNTNTENNIQQNVQPAVFSSFDEQQLAAPESRNLNMLLDIPLQVSVELGKTKRSVKEILELGSGSIIELDKLAGEPVDILVNRQLIAQGEVVVIDENFGVRITDIVSQRERIKQL
ncbi:flagellar motor switch phosphatase FliY [Heyndrickxia sporothermodurans]|uniref:Flagellar motor switch phosphatase FliY n=1 Tax=Heyndrickxia sporothermodurans TaxID=46224 RepID=A0AB37HKB9_9BACI|nr:flagellar motor switch phosphatase FliY [Heyndrickxia sporothermodurans]MBL5767221.1 flagellar motor switch phosphatase FliY [Heyndrickxia sporothermodurans]MBL5770720.1 flagellar motor switch phosphatase FliY [Heyndrickxia sporothermodurans]MBL5774452.1 flagellar motor switch phosphatase FliY [Heyndrickxia sporothermodurans]MBL5777999.1 flagellar motor switch phosphatase FliY [Heyndrickxia sporothermodurans]MBL5781607.1 flagellar motor switch phosphatase FliY [Heyndrickxia sporothermoduran